MRTILWAAATVLFTGAVWASGAHYDAHMGGVATTDFDTSSELAAICTDETGTGALVFGTLPTITTGIKIGTTDPADAGAVRLENAATECWEASPAGSDVCMSVNASEVFVMGAPMEVDASDPADSGAIRLDNNECIASEASPAGTDGTMCYDSSEYWAFSDPILVNGIDSGKPAIFRRSGGGAQVSVEAYGGGPSIVTMSAGGTFGAATTTQSGDNIGNYVGQGYAGSFTSQAAIQFNATQTYTGSARGTKIDFFGTPNASTTLTKRWTIDQDGSLTATGAMAVTTTGTVTSAGLVSTTLEANLTAGACTAGTWKVDNGGATRELCRCNDGGTAYDCISVTAANGPTD